LSEGVRGAEKGELKGKNEGKNDGKAEVEVDRGVKLFRCVRCILGSIDN